ncbi:myosin-xv [Plakobranchus ocellatus]|uniref:Myosin-xv n=1 Tax=Plakobranchus ocellatus TaxID=259542 RepID=A0AAV4BWC7_9GAST|nr:myosin-xv [Plakobranchus ocellatus]
MDNLTSRVSKINIGAGVLRSGNPGKSCTGNGAFITYHRENETGGLIETATSPNQNHVTARSLNTVGELRETFPNLNLGPVQDGASTQIAPLHSVLAKHYEYPKAIFVGDSTCAPYQPLIGAKELLHPKGLERYTGYHHILSDIDVHTKSPLTSCFQIAPDFLPLSINQNYHIRTSRRESSEGAPSFRSGVSPQGSPPLVRARQRQGSSGSPRLVRKAQSFQSLASGHSSKDGASGVAFSRPKFPFKHQAKLVRDKTKIFEVQDQVRSRKNGKKVVVPIRSSKSEDENEPSKTRKKKRHTNAKREDQPSDAALEDLSSSRADLSQDFLPRWTDASDPRAIQQGDVVRIGENGQLYIDNGGHSINDRYPYQGGVMFYPALDPLHRQQEMQVRGHHGLGLGSSGTEGFSSHEEIFYYQGGGGVMSTPKLKRGSGRYPRDDADVYVRSQRDRRKTSVQRRARSISPQSTRRHSERPRQHKCIHPHGSKTKLEPRSSASLGGDSDDSRLDKALFPRIVVTDHGVKSSNSPLRQRQPSDRFDYDSTSLDLKERHGIYLQVPPNFNASSLRSSNPAETDEMNPSPQAMSCHLKEVKNPYSGFPISLTSGPLDRLLRNTNLNLANMRNCLDAMSTSLASIPRCNLSSLAYDYQQADSLDLVEAQAFFQTRSGDKNQMPLSSFISSQHEREPHSRERSITNAASNPGIEDYLGDPVLSFSQLHGTTLGLAERFRQLKTNRDPHHIDSLPLHGAGGEMSNGISDIVDMGPHVSTYVGSPIPTKEIIVTAVDVGKSVSPPASIQNWGFKSTKSSSVQTDPIKPPTSPLVPPPPAPPLPADLLPLPSPQPSRAAAGTLEQRVKPKQLQKVLPYGEELRAHLSSKDSQTRRSSKLAPPPVLPKPKWALKRLDSQSAPFSASPTAEAPASPGCPEYLHLSKNFPFGASEITSPVPGTQVLASNLNRNRVLVDAEIRENSVKERVEEFKLLNAKPQSPTSPSHKQEQRLPEPAGLDRDFIYPKRSPPMCTDGGTDKDYQYIYPEYDSSHDNRTIIPNSDNRIKLDSPPHSEMQYRPHINCSSQERSCAYNEQAYGLLSSQSIPTTYIGPMANSSVIPKDSSTSFTTSFPDEKESFKLLPTALRRSSTPRSATSRPFFAAQSASPAGPLTQTPPSTSPGESVCLPLALTGTSKYVKKENAPSDQSRHAPSSPTSPFGGIKLPGFPALPPPNKIGSSHSFSVVQDNGKEGKPLSGLVDTTPYHIYRGDPGLLAALTTRNKSKSGDNNSSKQSKAKKLSASNQNQPLRNGNPSLSPSQHNIKSPLNPARPLYEVTENGFTLYKGCGVSRQQQKLKKPIKQNKHVSSCPSLVHHQCLDPLKISPISAAERPLIMPSMPTQTESGNIREENGRTKAASPSTPNGIFHAQKFRNTTHRSSEEIVGAPSTVSPHGRKFPKANNVPIPPKDFDSDADSSEYMYTSQGWSQMLRDLPDQNVAMFFCNGVEDNSAQVWRSVFDTTLWSTKKEITCKQLELSAAKSYKTACLFSKQEATCEEEVNLEKFFNACIPKFKRTVQHLEPGQKWPNSYRSCEWPLGESANNNSLELEMDFLFGKKSRCDSNDVPSNVNIPGGYLLDVVTRNQDDNPSRIQDFSCTLLAFSGRKPSHYSEQINTTSCVFMKEAFESRLDSAAGVIKRAAALRLQTMVRMFLVRIRHQRLRVAVARLQRTIRMWKCRRQFTTLRNGIVLAQAQFRMFSQRRRYLKTREQLKHKLEEHRLHHRKQEAQAKIERERRVSYSGQSKPNLNSIGAPLFPNLNPLSLPTRYVSACGESATVNHV